MIVPFPKFLSIMTPAAIPELTTDVDIMQMIRSGAQSARDIARANGREWPTEDDYRAAAQRMGRLL